VNKSAVTVVIPTRDRADLLALTLRSVLGQVGVTIDVNVVDDGEGPATAALVAALGDSRVQLIRNLEPRGVSGARNRGAAAAQGEWVAFCDDDDLWAPNKIVSQIAAAADHGAAWVYAGYVAIDENSQLVSGSPPPGPDEVVRDLVRYNAVPASASSVVIRADALARVGPFDPGLRTSEDWDLWLRLARDVGRPACVSRPLVALRAHPRMTSRRTEGIFSDIEVIARRHGIPVDRARHHRWAAWMALQDGRRGAAVRHYGKAVAAGDWLSAGRAAVALLNPRVAHGRRIASEDEWLSAARTWLDALRETEARNP
jgi:glycosyltransferase involved in cell wall biosynthesis